jgi:hypothetical protein
VILCELKGCQSQGADKESAGRFMVTDPELGDTMNRPAHMCQRCVGFAKQCGMQVKPV